MIIYLLLIPATNIINKNDIPAIMKSGHGSVKIRGKYKFENNNIVFTEMPYGITTEDLMTQIGELCDAGDITGIEDIRNESNRKQDRGQEKPGKL